MRKYIVGNWKMNGTSAELTDIALIADAAKAFALVDSALCLPATLIARASAQLPHFVIGAQDCHAAVSGAHTGCVSGAMLTDAGATLTIVGHSERRAAQNENDAEVAAKAQGARGAGLNVIVCVGETEAERDAGAAENIVLSQLAGSVPDGATPDWLAIAYEPVWAIGTGRVPTNSDVEAMHAAIRAALTSRFGASGKNFRILYGGSMNGENAAELLAIRNVDGGLIGGASLSAQKFIPILVAAGASVS